VPVRNVSPAANERDRACQTGEVADDVVVALLSAGEVIAKSSTSSGRTEVCPTGLALVPCRWFCRRGASSDNGTMVGVKEPREVVSAPLAVPMSLGAAGRVRL
jgi:hypothetical protein